MKTTMMRLTAGLGALLAAGHLYAGAQCRATGSVTDSTGAALADVTINITTPQLTSFNLDVKTDAKGNYATILQDCTMPYHLKFSKEGYLHLRPRQEDPDRRDRLDQREADEQDRGAGQGRRAGRAADVGERQGRHGLQRGRRGDAGRRQGGRRDEVPGRRQAEPGPSGRLAGARADGLREEGLGQGDRVRPEGHGPRPVAHQPVPDDGRRGDEVGRQEGRGRVPGAGGRRRIPTRRRSSTTRASRRTTRAR